MQEFLRIIIMTVGAFLWALGGWRDKYWRRFVMPIALLYLLQLYGVPITNNFWAMVTLCVVTHLPYGDSTPYWGKFLTGCSYALPSLIIVGLSWWLVLIPLIFIAMFALSNWKETENEFFWKLCEFICGTIIAASIVTQL